MGTPLNIFLILTMSTPGPNDPAPIPMHLGVDEEHLHPLNEEEITQYIRQFLGESNPPPQQIKDILSFSGGIPELVKTAIASLESSTARLTRDTSRLFSDRINNLSQMAKYILDIFTISEKPLAQEQLITFTGSAVESGILELNKAGLIRHNRREDHYTIATGAIASAAKEALSKEKTKEIAEKLLKHTLKFDEDDIDSIVRYASICSTPEELGKYLISAAEAKEKTGEIDQASDYYKEALHKMDADDEKRPGIYRKLARFSILTGKLDEATQLINDATGMTTTTVEDLISLSWVDRLQYKPKEALNDIQEALNQPDVKKDKIKHIKLLNEKGECYLQMGETKEAENIFRDTFDRAEKLSKKEQRKIANNNLGLALARDNKFKEAIEFYKNKYKLFKEDKRMASSIASKLGYVYQQANLLDDAYETYKESLELASATGDTHNAAIILGNIICLCQSKALFTDALKYAQEGIKLASQAASEKDLGSYFLTIGALYVNLGLEDVAKKYLTEAASLFQKLNNKHMEAWAQLSFSFLYKNIGKTKEALAYLDNVITQAEELKDTALHNEGCHDSAMLLIELSKFEKAKTYVDMMKNEWPGKDKATENDIKYELLRCKYAIDTEEEFSNDLINRLKEICDITASHSLREHASEAYHSLGTLYEKKGDHKKSAKNLTKAKEIIDVIVGNLSEEYRDSFLKQQSRQAVSEDSLRVESIVGIERREPKKGQEAPHTSGEQDTPVSGATVDFHQDVTSETSAIDLSAVASTSTSMKLGLIGQSEVISKIKNVLNHVKESHKSVFIYGEDGVGKSLAAKLIHMSGSFRNTPWQEIEFTDLPEEFIMDDLFGEEKEAILEIVTNGTLYLKNIENMPTLVQKELAKAIKNKKFKRLRDGQEIPLQCRFVASSHFNLNNLLKKKKFNKDLLKQLSGVPILIPPLKERSEDIPLLINHFLSLVAKETNFQGKYALDTDALKALIENDWSGNVRKLEQVIRSAAVLSPDGKITLEQINVHLNK